MKSILQFSKDTIGWLKTILIERLRNSSFLRIATTSILRVRNIYSGWNFDRKIGFWGFSLTVITTVVGIQQSYFKGSESLTDKTILGAWNDSIASEFVLDIISELDKPEDWGYEEFWSGKKMEHFIHSVWPVKYVGENTFVIVAYSRPEGHDCHACSPVLSLFEFYPNDKGWVNRKRFLNVGRYSPWGKPPDYLQILPIAFRKFGLFIGVSDINQGIPTGYSVGYAFEVEKNMDFEVVEILNGPFFEWFNPVLSSNNTYDLYPLNINWETHEYYYDNKGYYKYDGFEYVFTGDVNTSTEDAEMDSLLE